jgi:hypothetical protein
MDAPINVELCIFPSGVGLLRWFFSFGPEAIDLALPARFVRVICLLQKARELDEASDVPPLLRGYRKAEAIALLYDIAPPVKESITRYLSDTCSLIKGMPGALPLIERVPYRGAKLLYPVKLTWLPPGTPPHGGGSTPGGDPPRPSARQEERKPGSSAMRLRPVARRPAKTEMRLIPAAAKPGNTDLRLSPARPIPGRKGMRLRRRR